MPAVAAIFAMVFYVWASGLRRLRATTLYFPALWGAAVFAATAWRTLRPADDGPFVEYAAAVVAVTPTLALLGAKRPQNGAWQFIVLTMVAVLLLPLGQAWAYGDSAPHVPLLFRWLLAAHVLIGAVNYLPTAFAPAALCYAAGQAVLVGPFGPLISFEWERTPEVALALFTAALVAANVAVRSSERRPPGMQRLWRDFRDAYGLVWGLRVAERLNAAAQKHGWPIEFTWQAVIGRNGLSLDAIDAETRRRAERELRSMLRRFVSHEWIARRSAAHEPSVEA